MKKLFIFSFALIAKLSLSAQAAPTATVNVPPASTTTAIPAKSHADHDKQGHHDMEHQMTKLSAADRAVEYSQQLKKSLKLTDKQYNQVLRVNTECINRKDALKSSKDDMKQGSADIKAYRVGEFTKIFAADQLAAYQKMNKEGGMLSHKVNHDKDHAAGKTPPAGAKQ